MHSLTPPPVHVCEPERRGVALCCRLARASDLHGLALRKWPDGILIQPIKTIHGYTIGPEVRLFDSILPHSEPGWAVTCTVMSRSSDVRNTALLILSGFNSILAICSHASAVTKTRSPHLLRQSNVDASPPDRGKSQYACVCACAHTWCLLSLKLSKMLVLCKYTFISIYRNVSITTSASFG